MSDGTNMRSKPDLLCGVVGCWKTGKSSTCPADGTRHGHGRVHYESCHSELTFEADQWRLLCDEHLDAVTIARLRWEREVRNAS